ncbi:11551_t:CDS:10 [Funneliformis caledonium]|uniref:11551_t:CDS:1 n=1 Tax=Funneliformis caledonium TaxID=1117310 RepID=A0A9N9CTR3_9GLOM|nr:11551_t:CDS:10 [Funneliformis caledonium]
MKTNFFSECSDWTLLNFLNFRLKEENWTADKTIRIPSSDKVRYFCRAEARGEQVYRFWDTILQEKQKSKLTAIENEKMILQKKQDVLIERVAFQHAELLHTTAREAGEQSQMIQQEITEVIRNRKPNNYDEDIFQPTNKESAVSTVSKKVKSFSEDRVEGSTLYYNTSSSSSNGYDSPRTPPRQIQQSTSRNQDLIRRLGEAKSRVKSQIEPICSNIIDTTNKHLMERLQLDHDYHWETIINDATKYIDELIESVGFKDFYELSLFEAPRNPLLDKNSEGWINCHLLALLIDDCFLTCEEIQVHRCEEMSLASIMRKNIPREESEKKKSEHKIDIIFRIDDMEYFGAETFTDEDFHNSKPISYKHKLFREMKDQLDCLLKKLKFTKEMIKMVKNIVLHGISHGGYNGTMYSMYYDVDIRYYYVFESCQYRIGTILKSNNIIGVLEVVDKSTRAM